MGDVLVGRWKLLYRVFRSRLARPAPLFLRGATVGADRKPARPWARDPQGVFVAEGIDSPEGAKLILTYDPTQEATKILTSATALDPHDDEALLGFVNRWGLLGLAEPDKEAQLWDSVRKTKEELARIARLAQWLRAMKERKWRDKALPPLDEVRRIVSGVPTRLTPHQRVRAYWLAYANELNQSLWRRPVRTLLLPEGRSVRQYFRPRCLADVLYMTLWNAATDGDSILRQCPGCRGLFTVSMTNQKRRYCGPRCKNLANVRRWRAKRN